MGGSRWRIRTLSIYEQHAYVSSLWPSFVCRASGGLLICIGIVQPLRVTNRYRVRIEYRSTLTPKAWVEDPPLSRRDPDEPIPHTYPPDRPCLFHPRYGEWRPDMRIATTVIPWLLEWLVYYEAWQATGEWRGGGEHPLISTSGSAARDKGDNA